ncbi:MAG: hypothetical protein ACM3X6_14165 [Patescibacteria group bacterium]
MDGERPLVITNAEFAGYEEEDIDRITRIEHDKLARSRALPDLKAGIEAEMGPGHWEEHWVTVDADGSRVYADVYFGDHRTAAVTAAGDVVRDFVY